MVLDVWITGHGFEFNGLQLVIPGDVEGAPDYIHGAEALGAKYQRSVRNLQVGVVETVPDAVVERLAGGTKEEKVAGQPSSVVPLHHVGPIQMRVLKVDETNGHLAMVAEELLRAAFLGLVGPDAYGVEVVAEAAAFLLSVAKPQVAKQSGQSATSRKGDYTIKDAGTERVGGFRSDRCRTRRD